VAQTLDRVLETLVALISASDKDKIDAAKQKAEAHADKRTTAALGDAVNKLQQALSDPNPSAVASNVQRSCRTFLHENKTLAGDIDPPGGHFRRSESGGQRGRDRAADRPGGLNTNIEPSISHASRRR
jgi:hypothetical protein